MSEGNQRADDVAAQIAMMVLLRTVIGEVFFSDNRTVFRQRLSLIEQSAIGALSDQKLWQAPGVNEPYVREAASAWISRVIASILHPTDQASRDLP